MSLKDKDLIPFTDAEQKLIHKIVEERVKVETKFPLIFLLIVTFGFVSVLYGFEKMIDRFPFFEEQPWFLLGLGIIVLVVSGSTYKKLG
jgi:hypothetical protein